MKATLRIAAVADIHVKRAGQGSMQALFTSATEQADVLLLCGDLTDYGLVEEAKILAKEITTSLRIPVIGILGNHDFESGKQEDVVKIMIDAGVTMLESPRVLEGLPDEVALPLLQMARRREIEKSDLLYAFDERPSFVSYVSVGWFKLATFTPEGEERVLTVKRGGEFLSLEAAADAEFVTSEVVALTRASVLTWEVGDLRARFNTVPSFTIAVGRVLARAAQRDLRSRVISDSSRVAARLARILFQLAREQGKPVKDGLRLQLPLTQEELAELITVRRETVSLNFGELEREGVIRRDGRTVVVLVDAMEAYLERLGMGLEDRRRR